jgi:KDO2-lipid IV(A) lauroyltransferase
LTGICYRVGLAQWRIEAGAEIPTHENGQARTTMSIMSDINRAFEVAVRRDPANWFWVHNRWKALGKPVKRKPASRAAEQDPAAIS